MIFFLKYENVLQYPLNSKAEILKLVFILIDSCAEIAAYSQAVCSSGFENLQTNCTERSTNSLISQADPQPYLAFKKWTLRSNNSPEVTSNHHRTILLFPKEITPQSSCIVLFCKPTE